MAQTKRPKAPSFVSPKLVFKFPKLSEPDYGTKDYPKPDGEFSVKGVGKADDPAVKEFIATLQPFHDAAVKQAEEEFKALKVESRKKLGEVKVNDFYTVLYDEETEKPTGEVEFKFAMKYSGEIKNGPKAGKKWFRKPDIFDAKGNKMNPVPSIWGGTIGRVAFEIGLNKEGQPGYFIPSDGKAGISLKLQAARIIDLVSAGSRDASAYGFDEEEEGYTYDPSDAKTDEQIADKSERTEAAGGEGSGDDGNPDF